jgi:hypothetical protein
MVFRVISRLLQGGFGRTLRALSANLALAGSRVACLFAAMPVMDSSLILAMKPDMSWRSEGHKLRKNRGDHEQSPSSSRLAICAK